MTVTYIKVWDPVAGHFVSGLISHFPSEKIKGWRKTGQSSPWDSEGIEIPVSNPDFPFTAQVLTEQHSLI
jgi:hypothetical protein